MAPHRESRRHGPRKICLIAVWNEKWAIFTQGRLLNKWLFKAIIYYFHFYAKNCLSFLRIVNARNIPLLRGSPFPVRPVPLVCQTRQVSLFGEGNSRLFERQVYSCREEWNASSDISKTLRGISRNVFVNNNSANNSQINANNKIKKYIFQH